MAQTIDVTSLRLLRAIAETGTITAAAAELGYTQPAVSQHVRRLERRLGMPVLERHPRGVRLTEAGAVLARHGAFVAAAVDAAEREVTTLGALQAGRVRLVSFPSASATLVPAALAQLRQQAPGVQVCIIEAERSESLTRLRDGRCDVVVAFEHPEPNRAPTDWADALLSDENRGGLYRRHLLTDPTVLALAEDHPYSKRRRLHLRDLADDCWIAGCPQCRGYVVSACAAAGFTPNIIFGTDDHAATLAFVAAGLGVALLPGLVTLSPAARTPGVMVRSVGGVVSRTVFAATTPDLARLPAVTAVLDALAEAAAVC